jgi:hypothetical protein
MTKRRRMLHAYRLGLRHGLAHFNLAETQAGIARELALLRGEVATLKAEYVRAQQVECALTTEREFGARLH